MTERKGSGVVIERLMLKDFGKFHDKVLTLEPGLTILYGKNEAGKSTVHSFIRAMLFGLERQRGRAGRDALYTKYLPWDTPAAYGGSMDFELDGRRYRITRSFHKSQKSVSCICLNTGRDVELPSGKITDLMPDLTENLYRNTVSVEKQKVRTDAELTDQVRNYIANIAAAGDCEVDVRLALKKLNGAKKQLESEDPSGRIGELRQQIRQGEENQERLTELLARREELLVRRSKLARGTDEMEPDAAGETGSAPEQLPAVLEKYKAYKEYGRQLQDLSWKEQELRREIQEAERHTKTQERLRDAMDRLEELSAARRAVEEIGEEPAAARERAQTASVRLKGAFVTGLGMIAAVLSLLLTEAPAMYWGAAAGILLAAAGMWLWLFPGRRRGRNPAWDRERTEEQAAWIQSLKQKRIEILGKCGAPDEAALRVMYDAGLKREAAAVSRRQQADELALQILSVRKRLAGLRREITDYAARFMVPMESGPNETAIEQLEARVGEYERKLQGSMEERKREQTECDMELEKLQWELERAEGEEEKLERNRTELKELIELQKQNRQEYEAVLLAIRTIEELSARIHDSFGGRFGRTLSDMLAKYTGGEHTMAYLDEKLDIRVVCGENPVLLEKLSIGTIDQAYLALRLSVAGSLLKREDIPLILDDCFAYYDEERLGRVLTELAYNQGRQVLLFTCQRREADVADRLKLPHHDICLS